MVIYNWSAFSYISNTLALFASLYLIRGKSERIEIFYHKIPVYIAALQAILTVEKGDCSKLCMVHETIEIQGRSKICITLLELIYKDPVAAH